MESDLSILLVIKPFKPTSWYINKMGHVSSSLVGNAYDLLGLLMELILC